MLAGSWKYYKEGLCASWKLISLQKQRITAPPFPLQRKSQRCGIRCLGGPKSSGRLRSPLPQGSGCPQFRGSLLLDCSSAWRNAKVPTGHPFTTKRKEDNAIPSLLLKGEVGHAQLWNLGREKTVQRGTKALMGWGPQIIKVPRTKPGNNTEANHSYYLLTSSSEGKAIYKHNLI